MLTDVDDDAQPVRWISIPLDAETAERLARLSDVCHNNQVSVAASLLHDILKDDEETHMLLEAPAPSQSFN